MKEQKFTVLYLSIDCVRNGIWDRKLKPNLRTNIIASSIAAVLAGIICFSVSYRNYHKLIGSIATGVIMFVQVVSNRPIFKNNTSVFAAAETTLTIRGSFDRLA